MADSLQIPGVPGVDQREIVFGPSLPGPRRDPGATAPVVPSAPAAEEETPWYMKLVKGLLPFGADWTFGASPVGETDQRHSGDAQTRERAEQQTSDAASAKRQGVEPPKMDIFDHLY